MYVSHNVKYPLYCHILLTTKFLDRILKVQSTSDKSPIQFLVLIESTN